MSEAQGELLHVVVNAVKQKNGNELRSSRQRITTSILSPFRGTGDTKGSLIMLKFPI